MKVKSLRTWRIALPLRRPHTWAGNFTPVGYGYTVLKLELEDGTVGWGEAQVLKDWGGEFGSRYGEAPDGEEDELAAEGDGYYRITPRGVETLRDLGMSPR